jgi:hypothetical protein
MTKRWKRLALGLGLNLALGSGIALAQGWSNLPVGASTLHATYCYTPGNANNPFGCVFSQEGFLRLLPASVTGRFGYRRSCLRQ